MKEMRKDYEKPAMQVVKLQHTGVLMASGFSAVLLLLDEMPDGMQDYDWNYCDEM